MVNINFNDEEIRVLTNLASKQYLKFLDKKDNLNLDIISNPYDENLKARYSYISDEISFYENLLRKLIKV